MLGSACWVILLGYFLYFYPGDGLFIYFLTQMLGSVYWVILLGYFLYFYPGAGSFLTLGYYRWVELVSDETAQLLSYSQSTGSTGESGSQRRRHQFGALFPGNKGLYTFYFIYKVFNVV